MERKRWFNIWVIVAVLLLFCQVLVYMPLQTAEAAQNYIAPENSRGIIKNKTFFLSEYVYNGDGSLILTNTYHYVPGHVTTYYTINTIWSRYSSEDRGKSGYPKTTGTQGKDWVYSGVSAKNEDVKPGQAVSYSSFTYSQSQIRSMLETLFGELEPEVAYTIYMSPVYVLRERFADGTYKQNDSVKYDNLDAIRAAASWTTTTYQQFEAYYDIPLTFVMRGGRIWVVCVDMDNGNKTISQTSAVYVFGDTVEVVPTPQLTVDGEILNYARKWNFGFGTATLNQTGYPTEFEVTQDISGRRVFLGYSRKAAAVTPTPKPTGKPTNTPTPKPTSKPTGTPTSKPTSKPTNTPVPTAVPTAAPAPGEFKEIVRKEGQKVQIYADDYDSSTGALTDLQPYLTDDVAGTEGGIPSTEDVAIRAKAPGWEYDISLKEVTGKKESTRKIRVPVTIYYEEYIPEYANPNYPSDDDEDAVRNEEGKPVDEYGNIIPSTYGGYWESRKTSKSYDITIKADKDYSYWVVNYVDTYKADKVEVSNGAFGETQEISVDWSVSGAPIVPVPEIVESHMVKKKTMSTYSASEITVSFSGSINWSTVYEKAVSAANGYKSKIPELLVKSDKLVIDGETILSNVQKEKKAMEPDAGAVEAVKSKIKDTIYPQTYKSGIDLVDTSVNGCYDSVARYTYMTIDGAKIKNPDQSEMVVNDVKVHTPVVCDGIVTVDGKEYGRYENGSFQSGITVDFPLNGIYNPFTIEVSNYGTHRLILGYGERNFENAKKSGVKNMAVSVSGATLNEVRFPFGVYFDVNSDSFDADGNLVSYTDDVYFEAGTWICVGTMTPQFYVLGSLSPGVYNVEYRATSVNCPKDASGNYITFGLSQSKANTNISKYVATDMVKLNVYEDFMGFELNGTNDPEALEDYNSGQRMLTLSKGYFFNFYSKTIGYSFNSNSMKVTFTPTFTFISEDGKIRTDADLYYSESINGRSEYYIEVGSGKDATNVHTYTNRDELPGIAKDLLSYTESVLGSKIAGNAIDMFTFGGEIQSDCWFRMYPPLTNLLPNKYCSQCRKVYSETEARPCSHVSAPVTIFTMASMRNLIQNWYAGFYLPADTYCVTSDTREGYCDSCGKTRYVTEGRTTCPDHGTTLKVAAGGAVGTVPFSFNTYAANHTLTGDEEFFQKDGYVAISFDIMAIDSANSFVRQYNDFGTTEIAKQWIESGFPYRTGDVILYRLNKSIRDAYEIGGSE